MSEREIIARRAAVARGSYNPDAGTFTAVVATTNPVRRYGYDEVLSITPKSVRLDRLRSGRAPLLDSHRASSLADQVGVVTGARIENGQLVADLQLSARNDDRMKQIKADLAAGVLRNVSVGYIVHTDEETRRGEGERPIITRTDWEPAEVSLVALPADSKAHVRSLKGKAMDHEDDNEVIERNAEIDNGEGDTAAGPAPKNRTMSDRQVREAMRVAAGLNLPAELAQRHIDEGVTLQEFRRRAFEYAAEKSTEIRSSGVHEIWAGGGQSFDNPEFLGRTIEGVLYARMAGKAPEGAGRELMGRSLLDMGAMLMQARGERVSWANREKLASQILRRDWGGMHSTSDFPVLLTGAGNRILLDAYRVAQSPLKALARRRDANDFRAISMVRLSEAPTLDEVKEGGEITYGSRSEAKEGFALKTFAKIFSISRQAIINDDLGAFADSNMAWGRASAETEAGLLVSLFTANSGDGVKLDDGAVLYSTTRGNKAASGTAIDVDNLGAARQAMREVKGLDGSTPISATPRHLVVGAAKETEGEQILAQLAAAQVSEVNPFSGKLTLHVEPRLTGNAWRLFADPGELPTLVMSYLNGAEGPMLETREGWTTLGTEFRAVLDFGCGIQDWRGSYLNDGD